MQIDKVGKMYLIGDLHFGVDANSIAWLNHQKTFFNEVLIPYLKDTVQPGDILFQFGDIFETKQTLNVNIFNNVMDLFDQVSKILPVYVLIGNHDTYYTNNNDVNSLKILEDKPNVHVFKSPEIIGVNDKKILCLPWITDFNEIMTILEDNVDKADIVFAHMDVAGMSYDNGYPIQKGVDYNILTKYELVVSGHIHKPQVKGNFVYIGTPYHLDFGDVGQQKGFYELIFKPSPVLEFKRNIKSPEFKYFSIYELLEMNDKELKENFFNSFVKINGPNAVLQQIQKDDIKTYIKDLVNIIHKFDFNPIPDGYESEAKILKFNLNIPELAKDNLKETGLYHTDKINDIVKLFEKLYNISLEKMKKTNE